ncbi:MAG: tandem-95 repeat protein, partial [Hyphomicrobiaceae bacterium]
GNDLEVVILETLPGARDGGRITVRDGYLQTGTTGIDQISFDDGTTWSRSQFETLSARNVATSGDDWLTGTSGADTLIGLHGNDLLTGGAGADTYRYSRGDGADIIRDNGDSAVDVLEISGYARSELTFARRGTDAKDFVIRLAANGDEIVVFGGLEENGTSVVETIRLVDSGETLSLADVRAALLLSDATTGDDIIVGTTGNDVIDGKAGNDLLVGGNGDDTYVYRRGDGDDRIDAFGTGHDTVRLANYNVADVSYAIRGGADSNDLVVQVTGTGDRLVLVDALGGLNGTSSTGLTVAFADGAVWDRAAMRARALNDIDTTGHDAVHGFDGADLLDAKAGNDAMFGGAGFDTYDFGRGDGNDTVSDASTSATDIDQVRFLDFTSSEASVERLFRGSETVVIRFASSSNDSVTVIDALSTDGRGIETYRFADGVIWTKAMLRTLVENHAPVASGDGPFSVISGEQLTIRASDLLANDFDADGDALRIVAADGGAAGVATLTTGGDIVFTPKTGSYGPTTISYTVADGRGGTSSVEIDVRVRPIATARDDSGFSANEDSQITIRVERLLSNDLDGDRMIVGSVFGGSHGTAALTSDGNIVFTPDPDYTGEASFVYAANTPEGGRAEGRVYISVQPVNDAPVAVDDHGFLTDEDTVVVIYPEALLANDRDIDGDVLSLVSVLPSANFDVVIGAFGELIATPRSSFWGDGYFDYTIADPSGLTSTARAFVHVNPV